MLGKTLLEVMKKHTQEGLKISKCDLNKMKTFVY